MEYIDIITQKGEKGRTEKLTVELPQVLGQVVLLASPHLKYMSKESMRDWILGSCDLVEETMDWMKSSKVKSKITIIRKFLDRRYDKMSREYLANYLMNLVLTGEGMGNLSGFGYDIKGSSFSQNPEYIFTSSVKE